MELRLVQKRLDPIERYTISSNDAVLFRSERSLRRSFFQETLLRDPDGKLLLTIRPRFHWWRDRYDFVHSSGATLEFSTSSFLKSTYQLGTPSERLTIYTHRSIKPKYSIFRHGIQVAAILRRPYSILDDDVFRAVLGPQVDPMLISAVVLTLDRIESASNGLPLFTLHFLPSLFEERPFDNAWLRAHSSTDAA